MVQHNARWGRPAWRALAPIIAGALLLLSCAPTAPASRPDASGGSSSGGSSSAPTAPGKVLRIGLQADREPPSPALFGSSGSGSSTLENFFVFHAALTIYDPSGATVPQLAAKVPSLSDGDWKILPEGGMEVTWKIKPNVLWHDGKPLTSADFLFGFQINNDPGLTVVPGELANITNLQAPDDQTIVATWKTTTIAGGISAYDGIPAAPKHLLGDLYANGDKNAFTNSPYWNTDWVGLGPYRLTQWERGSYIEGTAFDQYFGGRAKIDKVILKMLGDANAIVANVLSGDIDIIPLGAQLDVPPLASVAELWAVSKAGTTGAVAKGVRTLYLQYRDPTVPWAQDVRVRQAMLESIDRDNIVETLEAGLTQRADFFAPIGDPVLGLAASRGLTAFKFDPTQAARLMSEMGWTKGADGTFRSPAGVPFKMGVSTSAEGANPQEAAIIASHLSTAGFAADPTPFYQTVSNRNEQAMNFTGSLVKPWNFSLIAPGTIRQTQIGTAQNAWAGTNYGGYVNQGYDDLYRAFSGELDTTKRQEAFFNIVKLINEQLPVLPIFYVPQTYAFRQDLTGPGTTAYLQAASTWNINTWSFK